MWIFSDYDSRNKGASLHIPTAKPCSQQQTFSKFPVPHTLLRLDKGISIEITVTPCHAFMKPENY